MRLQFFLLLKTLFSSWLKPHTKASSVTQLNHILIYLSSLATLEENYYLLLLLTILPLGLVIYV